MNIEFGIVTRYFPNRGFGFVSQELMGIHGKHTFFHISTLENTFPELANAVKCQSDDETTFFWYEVGNSSKGAEVVNTFDYEDISSLPLAEYRVVFNRLRLLWENLDFQLPDWMEKVAENTLTEEEFSDIQASRLTKIESVRSKRLTRTVSDRVRVSSDNIDAIEEKEFSELVEETRELGFEYSSDLSAYIRRCRLGLKYQHISGHLEMKMDGESWTFDGGFPPNIYARLCRELDLKNYGSSAKPSNFTSYKDLKKK
jgi:cold shock CspA family protein